MQCTNPSCGKQIRDGVTFCPFCGNVVSQGEAKTASASGLAECRYCGATIPKSAPACPSCGRVFQKACSSSPRNDEGNGSAVAGKAHSSAPLQFANSEDAKRVVLRAGEQIWHFEEEEQDVKPGQRRPMIVVDEQVTHLAHTDRKLTSEELLERTRTILAAQEVPVDVRMLDTRWMKDKFEVRPRLVASLKDHAYSDVKMIFGVDYLGKWASIQLQVGAELDPIPPPPPIPKPKPFRPPWDVWVALALGILLLVAVVGFFILLYAGWRLYASFQKYREETAAERDMILSRHRDRQRQREAERARERLSRTFKVDDMRLFCSAMQVVYQSIVDDIVERGAEVVRIQGGQGGYFDVASEQAIRRSDASFAEV